MKISILFLCVLLMAAVLVIGVAGVIWLSRSELPTRNGGMLVLSVSSVAAAGGLLLLWRARSRQAA